MGFLDGLFGKPKKRESLIEPEVKITVRPGEMAKDAGQKKPLGSLKERMNASRANDLERMRGLGIKKIALICAGDERDCDWCKEISGKEMSIKLDVGALIEKSCTCESHCRCIIRPTIEV